MCTQDANEEEVFLGNVEGREMWLMSVKGGGGRGKEERGMEMEMEGSAVVELLLGFMTSA